MPNSLSATQDRQVIRVVDLFAGCGGFSMGFEITGGYEIVAGNDSDDDSLYAFARNHPRAMCWKGPIGDLDPSPLRRLLGLARGELDVMIGGPPCQGFSRNRPERRQAGQLLDDPRNYLFMDLLRFAQAFLPEVLVIENVPDMLTQDNGRYRDEILRALRRIGFLHCETAVLNAADYGVPQRRRRAFVIASRTTRIAIPSPSFADDTHNGILPALRPWRTIRDALSDLPSLSAGEGCTPCDYRSEPLNDYQRILRGDVKHVEGHVAWTLSSVQSERLAHLQEGDGLESLPDNLTPRASYGGAYRRMSWDRPALTITTWMYHPGSGMFYHPADHRTITLREGARLQSFPDSARFYGGKVSRCRQVGNAVPPLMGAAIAREIRRVLS